MKHPEAQRQDFVPNNGKFFDAQRDESEVPARTTHPTSTCIYCDVTIVEIAGEWWHLVKGQTPRHSPPHKAMPALRGTDKEEDRDG